MKIKLLIISFSILTSQAFAKVECKGTDVSNWNNCIGETANPNGEISKGPYIKGKKHGFFRDSIWVYREHISSDGYSKKGRYVKGIKQGIWSYCYTRQVSYTYFRIGKYNEKGERDGPWGEFNTYEQDFMDGSNGKYWGFSDSGCYVETALYHLNKEDQCSAKKSPLGGSNLFTNINVYKNGDLVDSGGVCNHPTLDTTGEYKNTSMFKEWVKLLENYEN